MTKTTECWEIPRGIWEVVLFVNEERRVWQGQAKDEDEAKKKAVAHFTEETQTEEQKNET